ncbi:hypothetical protein A9Q90_05825 [Gammaproteobacteria bacterium 54_18_T64]|nr:hypothetical protein A9Q90_05825 [Gammaproteobacteria bacterium 54_18_T64]
MNILSGKVWEVRKRLYLSLIQAPNFQDLIPMIAEQNKFMSYQVHSAMVKITIVKVVLFTILKEQLIFHKA